MKLYRNSFVVLALCAVVFASCGGDDDTNNGGGTTSAPQTENKPQPQSTDPLWKRVFLQNEVAASPTETCMSPKRFVVLDTGSYAAGPCVLGQPPVQGVITAAEQTELNRVVNLMIEAGNRTRRSCQQIGVLNETSVKVTLDNNTTYTAFEELTDTGRCYRGETTNVDEVRAYLAQLEAKYYPTGNPTPSPSPSTSVSPSPSPSVSPSPIPSVSPSPSPSVTPSPSPSPLRRL